MTMPLLTTKFYIAPIRPDPATGLRTSVVPRPRLVEQLNQGTRLGHQLTLISAPAGFGKTTLISEWHQVITEAAPSLAVAWLTLDAGDNDLSRFLTYVIAALQTVDGRIGEGLKAALQSPGPVNVEAILTPLLNQIAALSNTLVLVLDDYHVIESQPVDRALAFALEHLPPRMHLVIASRMDPSLPLSRLRAGGRMIEIREADLRFTPDEIHTFLDKVMGLDLSAEKVAALEARTEGWIAGLQLAALSMQGLDKNSDIADFIEHFTGSDRYIQDYLADEVLQQRPTGTKDFLLHTSILDRLSGPLCDAVRFGTAATHPDQQDSQVILEALDAANLFIVPLDNERRWYRYHQLFSDLLRQRLRQKPPPLSPPPGGIKGDLSPLNGGAIVAELHIRASEWYEQHGFSDAATEHALRGEHFERAAHLIEAYVDNIWQSGEHAKLRRWLDGIPLEVTYANPHLCILDAGSLFTTGPIDEAERRLRIAEQMLEAGPFSESDTGPAGTDRPPVPEKTLRGRAAVIRSHLLSHQGDATASIRSARRALGFLPQSDAIWRWSAFDSMGTVYSCTDEPSAYQARSEALQASKATGNMYMILLASLRLVVTLRDLGRLWQARDICQQQLKLANENGLSQSALVGWLYALWGEILAEQSDLDNALQLVNKGVALTRRGKDMTLRGSSYLCLMRVLYSRGNMEMAQEVIQDLNSFTPGQDLSPWIRTQLAAWQARIRLAQGRLAPACHWAKHTALDVEGELLPIHDFDYIVLARVLIAQGRLDEASSLLQRLLEAAKAGGRTSKVIEILVLQALAAQAGGEMAQAATILERALTLAEPGGFVRVFVDEGRPMARLLSEATAHGMLPDYTVKLLAAFEAKAQPGKQAAPSFPPPAPAAQPLIEPLSSRELEVLALIAQGLSNREIGERLVLTVNTVKGHNRNIYGKLEVNRRTEAVARARELGLL